MEEFNQTLLKQVKLDHEQHYDLDGVTMKNNEILIPKNFNIQTHFENNLFIKDKTKETKTKD